MLLTAVPISKRPTIVGAHAARLVADQARRHTHEPLWIHRHTGIDARSLQASIDTNFGPLARSFSFFHLHFIATTGYAALPNYGVREPRTTLGRAVMPALSLEGIRRNPALVPNSVGRLFFAAEWFPHAFLGNVFHLPLSGEPTPIAAPFAILDGANRLAVYEPVIGARSESIDAIKAIMGSIDPPNEGRVIHFHMRLATGQDTPEGDTVYIHFLQTSARLLFEEDLKALDVTLG